MRQRAQQRVHLSVYARQIVAAAAAAAAARPARAGRRARIAARGQAHAHARRTARQLHLEGVWAQPAYRAQR